MTEEKKDTAPETPAPEEKNESAPAPEENKAAPKPEESAPKPEKKTPKGMAFSEAAKLKGDKLLQQFGYDPDIKDNEARQESAKNAYKKAALFFHPDKNKDNPEASREGFENARAANDSIQETKSNKWVPQPENEMPFEEFVKLDGEDILKQFGFDPNEKDPRRRQLQAKAAYEGASAYFNDKKNEDTAEAAQNGLQNAQKAMQNINASQNQSPQPQKTEAKKATTEEDPEDDEDEEYDEDEELEEDEDLEEEEKKTDKEEMQLATANEEKPEDKEETKAKAKPKSKKSDKDEKKNDEEEKKPESYMDKLVDEGLDTVAKNIVEMAVELYQFAKELNNDLGNLAKGIGNALKSAMQNKDTKSEEQKPEEQQPEKTQQEEPDTDLALTGDEDKDPGDDFEEDVDLIEGADKNESPALEASSVDSQTAPEVDNNQLALLEDTTTQKDSSQEPSPAIEETAEEGATLGI
ncbi:hypothetical protein FOG18_03185 [Legionella israelensis]|uniref:J domain-containing protein n=1 Tax=Legionella israelensis TaxID=454 RepID=UPI001180B886|nr:J domain-containing protein [Legionella israelensis]QDP71648.1 hypothetical protein FOG18_03185 [Legionella israelensis]